MNEKDAEAERGKMPRLEPNTDNEGDHEMEANAFERMFQDDVKWTLNSVDDMCVEDDPEVQRVAQDYAYYDENT